MTSVRTQAMILGECTLELSALCLDGAVGLRGIQDWFYSNRFALLMLRKVVVAILDQS